MDNWGHFTYYTGSLHSAIFGTRKKLHYTNSLVNATFGSGKKSCEAKFVLTKLVNKHEEKCVLVREFLFHNTC